MHNVEFKAELREPQMARGVCRAIGATYIGVLEQTDTYYRVPSGKLKRRETVGEATEVIFYERPRSLSPKLSHFTIYTEAAAEERFGREPPPIWLVVKKKRELWMYDGVRVHIDEVEGLGWFVEFEAMVSDGTDMPACHALVAELRRVFGPAMGEPIDRGYAELLSAGTED